MWSPSCVLEQSRFLIASATVRFIGVAIVPIANAPAGFVQRVGASSALIAPAGLIGAAIGVLDHGGDPCRWRHHSSRSPSFAFASLNFILKTVNPCWAFQVRSPWL